MRKNIFVGYGTQCSFSTRRYLARLACSERMATLGWYGNLPSKYERRVKRAENWVENAVKFSERIQKLLQ